MRVRVVCGRARDDGHLLAHEAVEQGRLCRRSVGPISATKPARCALAPRRRPSRGRCGPSERRPRPIRRSGARRHGLAGREDLALALVHAPRRRGLVIVAARPDAGARGPRADRARARRTRRLAAPAAGRCRRRRSPRRGGGTARGASRSKASTSVAVRLREVARVEPADRRVVHDAHVDVVGRRAERGERATQPSCRTRCRSRRGPPLEIADGGPGIIGRRRRSTERRAPPGRLDAVVGADDGRDEIVPDDIAVGRSRRSGSRRCLGARSGPR